MKVELFITCVCDTFYPDTARATVRLLERLGHDVRFRPTQTCCGQMHLNSGYPAEARALARKLLADFADAETIVIPSSSCTATIRAAYEQLADDDPALHDAWRSLASRVHELTEFLLATHGPDLGAYFPHRVTYHPTCNSLRALHLGGGPLRLLRAVRGIDLVELPDASQCCGFGGTFAIKNADTSSAMLADKMRAILSTGAEIVTAADRSCLMHIAGGLSRLNAGVRALHIADILAADGT